METVNLVIRGKAESIEISFFPEQLNGEEIETRVKAFLDKLDIDSILRQVAEEIIEGAYSQSDEKPSAPEIDQLLQYLVIHEIECYDDDLVIFLDAQGIPLTIQLEYEAVGEIENWELDFNA